MVLAVVQLVAWLGSPFVKWLGFGAELVVWPWRQKPRFGLRQRKKWLGFGAELVVVWPWRQKPLVDLQPLQPARRRLARAVNATRSGTCSRSKLRCR